MSFAGYSIHLVFRTYIFRCDPEPSPHTGALFVPIREGMYYISGELNTSIGMFTISTPLLI